MTRTVQERFWPFVVKVPERNDCWFWIGAISDNGYGQFSLKRGDTPTAMRPQRYAYELAAGWVCLRLTRKKAGDRTSDQGG